MKTFDCVICLVGIMIFKVLLCSTEDGLTEAQLEKIYTFGMEGDIIHTKNYEIVKGETIVKPARKILMKMENPPEEKNESYVSHEITVLKDLKQKKVNLLKECITDMLNHGTYGGKNVLIIPRFSTNLKEYSSEPYSWENLSEMGPRMIKAVRLLHKKQYVHRNLKPEVFAFGTEEQSGKELVPLKNQVYLFDVGLAEKYRYQNNRHKPCQKIDEFFGEMAYASRGAMLNLTQSRGDDIESIYYVLAYLAGLTSPFEEKEIDNLHNGKFRFCFSWKNIKEVFEKSKITEVRVFHALLDFAHEMTDFLKPFSKLKMDFEKEPDYDGLIKCFDQGLSEKEINAKYEFIGLDKFDDSKSTTSSVGLGSTKTNRGNKMDVIMKLLKSNPKADKECAYILSYKVEIRVYNDLKRGLKHSLLRENICDMLDHGVYDGHRAIIMPRLGIDWQRYVAQNHPKGLSYGLLCKAARYAIGALRFLHNRGYVHQDIKLSNFAFGSADFKGHDRSQADMPLKERLYLLDFGLATKWRFADKTHKPRVKVVGFVGTYEYLSRTAIAECSQSRRDDMESLMFTLAIAAVAAPIFMMKIEDGARAMWEERNEFITVPNKMIETFEMHSILDTRVHQAFIGYAAVLNTLFVTNGPEHYEKEPDYNAFCVCFGGMPGDNACAV